MIRKKLLFLDFDGVLHPNFCDPEHWFSCNSILLSAVHSSREPLEIVVSSSWRFHHSFDELLKFLPIELRPLIVDTTPMVEPGRYQRFREISAYLKQRYEPVDWRALDDDLREFPPTCQNLIACDGRRGIENRSEKLLRDWIMPPTSNLTK